MTRRMWYPVIFLAACLYVGDALVWRHTDRPEWLSRTIEGMRSTPDTSDRHEPLGSPEPVAPPNWRLHALSGSEKLPGWQRQAMRNPVRKAGCVLDRPWVRLSRRVIIGNEVIRTGDYCFAEEEGLLWRYDSKKDSLRLVYTPPKIKAYTGSTCPSGAWITVHRRQWYMCTMTEIWRQKLKREAKEDTARIEFGIDLSRMYTEKAIITRPRAHGFKRNE